MSAGLAERIVVSDRSEGPVLQCGVMGERPQKNDPFFIARRLPRQFLFFLSFPLLVSVVPASGFILAPALSLHLLLC